MRADGVFPDEPGHPRDAVGEGGVAKGEPDLVAARRDATRSARRLLRDLRSSPDGLSSSEAQRRLRQYGRNMLVRRGGRRWPRNLLRQVTHPLALLLWGAAALALAAGISTVAIAIVLVIVVNALFAF